MTMPMPKPKRTRAELEQQLANLSSSRSMLENKSFRTPIREEQAKIDADMRTVQVELDALPAAPSGMPVPKPVDPTDAIERPVGSSFGDLRPQKPPAMPKVANKSPTKPERILKPDAKPMPNIETYRQTNGPMYMSRMKYNGVWLTAVAVDQPQATYNAEQFYMNETAQGQKDSIVKHGEP